jgi:hypothetical protein
MDGTLTQPSMGMTTRGTSIVLAYSIDRENARKLSKVFAEPNDESFDVLSSAVPVDVSRGARHVFDAWNVISPTRVP